MLFRDVSAWYHIVVTKDTTQATETDRLKVYVNGKNIDTLRNDAIEAIEDTLELDRTRGGAARYSRVSEVTVDFDMADMYGKVDVMVEVYYTYPRGQS